MAETGRDAFEKMAESGHIDAGAAGLGLRRDVAGEPLRELAAMAVHAAAAAPERMIEVYDNAAAGWLGAEVSAPRTPILEPLPISPGCWRTFWSVASPPAGLGRQRYAERMMELAGELDPRINPRMAAAAEAFPGVAAAAAGGPSQAYDFEWLCQFSPASLAYALSQEIINPRSSASDPYWTSVIPYLRHMPPPLNYINVEVIRSMPLWGLVAGYTTGALDRVAMGGFLMGQVGHHYSALASALTLTTAAMQRPENLHVIVDGLLKGWAHGRETPPLVQVSWEPLLPLRVDQVRETLGIRAFAAPYATETSTGWTPRVV